MFPRRYFAGREFAPRYFPQSQGQAPIVASFSFWTPQRTSGRPVRGQTIHGRVPNP